MKLFDVIGPVMIGPSSSHTAGAVRLGNVALSVLGEPVEKAVIGLHGSFAQTYRGHGTDLALVAGLQGWVTDDPRIACSFDHARGANLSVEFRNINLGELAHPNSVKFWLTGIHGAISEVAGASVGGGRVTITEVDGFPVEFSGEFPTLLTIHHDRPGVISLVTSILSTRGVNVAQMRVFRKQKGGLASMVVETDEQVEEAELKAIASLPQIKVARRIRAL
jgi:L-serine dehydratase